MSASVTFWFEFASTYSYLSAMRIDAEADKRNVDVIWKPFLLGPIFKAQGWDTSPFRLYPIKGMYMWRDMERRTAKYGLPFKRPTLDDPRAFPQHSVLAARTAIAALHEDWGRDFCRKVYLAEFAEGKDISDPSVIGGCIDAAGGIAEFHLRAAQADAQKSALRANTDDAQAFGIFGAPCFTIDDELFWGDDRLEDALDWAAQAN